MSRIHGARFGAFFVFLCGCSQVERQVNHSNNAESVNRNPVDGSKEDRRTIIDQRPTSFNLVSNTRQFHALNQPELTGWATAVVRPVGVDEQANGFTSAFPSLASTRQSDEVNHDP